jgi:hypothetical protein
MSRPSVLVVVLLAAAGLGCAADLGGGGGIEARTAHAVGFGRAAASTKVGTPLNNDGILIGSSLESRTEAKLGARYDVGLMLGWGTGPAAIGGKWGFEAYLEGGTPIRGGFFRDGDWFLGGTVAAPFHMGSPRQVQELNGSTWFATSRLEVVPMLRLRRHRDHPEDADALTRVDVELGLVFRLRVLSDLF